MMRRDRLAGVLVALGCTVGATPAWALFDDVVVPRIIAGFQYDSNVFRAPDDQTNASSSNIKTGGVGLRIDKTYGLQNFTLDANVMRVIYTNLSQLDATSREIAAGLKWKVTPSIGGNLIYRHSVTPNSFADVGFQTTRNLRTIDEKRFDIDWLPGAALHPQLSVFENEQSSDRPSFQQENSKTRSVMGSLVYLFPSFNSVEAYVRRANGTYQDFQQTSSLLFLATDFNETEAGVRAHWVFNGLSTLDGNLGYLRRTNDGLEIRDFTGFVGRLTYNYQITGKNKFETTFNRQLFSTQTDIYSYATQDDLRVGWVYTLTTKTALKPAVTYQRRLFKGPVIVTTQELRQYTRGVLLDATWEPIRALTITGTIAHEKRAATISSFNYSDNTAQISGTFRF